MIDSFVARSPCARFAALAATGAALLLNSSLAYAGTQEPSVPYVPTPQNVVERMLEIAKVGAQDYLIDLGSGDGRIVVTAAKKHGARGYGVDLNPARISEANTNARAAGVTSRVSFHQRDLFETDLTQATVITMYLLPRVNLDLRPKLLDLRPGTRIVSHDFSMGDWKPEVHEQLEAATKYGGSGGLSDIYLWIVPAKVGGTWQAQLQLRGKPVTYEFSLQQQFQMVSGSATAAGRRFKLQNAKLNGAELTFDFIAEVDGMPVKHAFSGTVNGAVMTGTADLAGPSLQAKLDWNAKRAGPSATGVSDGTASVASGVK